MSILFSLDIHHHHHDTCIYIIYIYIYELFIYSPSCLSYKMGGFVPLVLTLFPLKFEGGYIYMYILSLFFLLYIYRDIYACIYICYISIRLGLSICDQAHARARFSHRVEREDFEEAMRLMKASKDGAGAGDELGIRSKNIWNSHILGINIYEPGFFAN